MKKTKACNGDYQQLQYTYCPNLIKYSKIKQILDLNMINATKQHPRSLWKIYTRENCTALITWLLLFNYKA